MLHAGRLREGVAAGVALDVSPVPHCELRRHTGERAHARIIGMHLTACGQARPHPPQEPSVSLLLSSPGGWFC